ncbi:carbonic anhydrase [Thozetella sp. PMI_491]|nr:carbonic anhydrase [Thozetella sp. PMI_491]
MPSPDVLPGLLAGNSKFTETYHAPPGLMTVVQAARSSGAGVIIISCSDPRLNPYQIFGMEPTPKGVTMVRNAGGRAIDAIRTISVLQTIGNPKTVVVVHHTDCGMTHFHDSVVRERLIEFAPQEKEAIEATRYGEILGSIEDSVREDVAFLSASPFVTPGTRIVGLKYDISTGVATQVTEATRES